MSIQSDVEMAELANSAKVQPTQTKEVEAKAEASEESNEVENKSAAAQTLAEITDESGSSDSEKTEAEDQEIDEPEKGAKQKDNGFEKRLKKLVKDRSKARQEADFWRAEALKKQNEQSGDKPKEFLKLKDDKPVPDQFGSHEEYLDARDEWNRRKWKAEEQEREVKTHIQRKSESFIAKKNEFEKTHDDYEEVVQGVSDIPMSLTVQEVLLDDGGKPDLAYALAKNKEEYKRICALPPIAAARELGKFEARLNKSQDSSEKPESKKLTKAPKPIAPVGTKAKSDRTIYDGELSQRDFEQLREEQLKSQRN